MLDVNSVEKIEKFRPRTSSDKMKYFRYLMFLLALVVYTTAEGDEVEEDVATKKPVKRGIYGGYGGYYGGYGGYGYGFGGYPYYRTGFPYYSSYYYPSYYSYGHGYFPYYGGYGFH